MYFQIVLFLLLIIESHILTAQQNKTSWRDIKPIIAQKCSPCHNKSASSPFKLLTYKDVSKKHKMIEEVVKKGYMPPLVIDTNFSHFENVIKLDSTERNKILSWIEQGMIKEKGEKDIAIKMNRVYTKKGIKISLNKDFVLGESPKDQYLFSVISLPIKDSIFIDNYSFIVKNKHLHHAELLDLMDNNPKNKNRSELGYYYESTNPEIKINRYLLGWFPGASIGIFPKKTGMTLYGDRKYLLIMHYSPSLEKFKEKSFIKISKSKKEGKREVLEYALHGTLKNIQENRGAYFIKANEQKIFHYIDTITTDMSAFGMYFHAHHLCQSMKAYAVTPQNDTINLLKIDKWKFEWQFTYRLDKYIKIPAGSAIHCEALYDNSAENPQNPNRPPKDVKASFYAEDEMMEFFILHLDYKVGDENLKVEYQD
jgi:hypothetical protein